MNQVKHQSIARIIGIGVLSVALLAPTAAFADDAGLGGGANVDDGSPGQPVATLKLVSQPAAPVQGIGSSDDGIVQAALSFDQAGDANHAADGPGRRPAARGRLARYHQLPDSR